MYDFISKEIDKPISKFLYLLGIHRKKFYACQFFLVIVTTILLFIYSSLIQSLQLSQLQSNGQYTSCNATLTATYTTYSLYNVNNVTVQTDQNYRFICQNAMVRQPYSTPVIKHYFWLYFVYYLYVALVLLFLALNSYMISIISCINRWIIKIKFRQWIQKTVFIIIVLTIFSCLASFLLYMFTLTNFVPHYIGYNNNCCQVPIVQSTQLSDPLLQTGGLNISLGSGGTTVLLQSNCAAEYRTLTGIVWQVQPTYTVNCTPVNVSVLQRLQTQTCDSCSNIQSCIIQDGGFKDAKSFSQSQTQWSCFFTHYTAQTIAWWGYQSKDWEQCYVTVNTNASVTRTVNGAQVVYTPAIDFVQTPLSQYPYGYVTNGTYVIALSAGDGNGLMNAISFNSTLENMVNAHITSAGPNGIFTSPILQSHVRPFQMPCKSLISIPFDTAFTQFTPACLSTTLNVTCDSQLMCRILTSTASYCSITFQTQSGKTDYEVLNSASPIQVYATKSWNCDVTTLYCNSTTYVNFPYTNVSNNIIGNTTNNKGSNGSSFSLLSSANDYYLYLFVIGVIAILIIALVIAY